VKTYTYDAENRLATFNGSAATYSYDGDGRRVKKVMGPATMVLVYDAHGQMVAEYSNPAPPTSAGTSYVTADHLGSTRLVTDSTGTVIARHDYAPFGEEISSVIGGRGGVTGYGVDEGLRQKFTGKERDTESGLDYYGARYFAPNLGRFVTPDQYMPSADVKDPQGWNRYVLARNSPLRFIDPDGLDWSDLSEEQKRAFQTYANQYNETNKSTMSPEQVYNTLNESQMATFESVTYAMEHTQLIDSAGNNMGNALQQVAGVTAIAGEVEGAGGDKQFRIYADLKPGAIDKISRSQGFEYSPNEKNLFGI
jgi:RHS repeat-associated protein